LKIGQHLALLKAKVEWHFFSRHDVYDITLQVSRNGTCVMTVSILSPTTNIIIQQLKWNLPTFPSQLQISTYFVRYSFPILLTAGGWVGLGGWLLSKMAYPQRVTHLWTTWAWHRTVAQTTTQPFRSNCLAYSRHWVCKPAYLVTVQSQNKLGELQQKGIWRKNGRWWRSLAVQSVWRLAFLCDHGIDLP